MNLKIASGITVIVGRSGAGKTTLLRRLAGLEGIASPYRSVGYVTQEPYLFPHLSVQENVLFGYRRVPKEKRIFTDGEVIDWLNIRPLLERDIPKLSGGERQRIVIARSVLMSPEILLMDEPVSALDCISKAEVLNALLHLRQKINIPILYVTHNESELVRLADQVILLKSGKIALQGSLEALWDNATFLQETGFTPPLK